MSKLRSYGCESGYRILDGLRHPLAPAPKLVGK